MQVRRARESDLPVLVAISEAASSDARWTIQQWQDIFHTQTPARHAWIAEDSGAKGVQGIGFLVAQNVGRDWELENIAVLPAFRRRGIGRLLLSALQAKARSEEAERILLEVRASNESAIHLYRASGFQPLSRRKSYYLSPLEDALVLVRIF
ncbi:MAG: ribosomal-protein-alanine N-acetyltransferase [Acidobacteria bacterium]|nr:MAG: ribosomal-protein-alanine N-acetyltransferase [Acidobacteriota bacterium]